MKIYFMSVGSQKYKLAKYILAYHLEWKFFGMVEPLQISAPLKPGLSHIISHSLNRFSNSGFCTDLKKKIDIKQVNLLNVVKLVVTLLA